MPNSNIAIAIKSFNNYGYFVLTNLVPYFRYFEVFFIYIVFFIIKNNNL